MTYAADVASQRSADKIELYRFDGPLLTYSYTSGTRSITYAAIVYAPLAGLRRSARGASSSADKAALTATMSGACDLATDYAYAVPPRSLRLRIYEQQRGSTSTQLVWDGDVVACSAKGTEIELRSESQLSSRLATPVPGVVFQKRCNHVLGDERCRVDLTTAANKHTSTVVSASGFAVTIASIGAFPDDDFRGGQIVRDSDGERRTISGQTGAALTLTAPFRALTAADAVTLYVGCSKLVARCLFRFANVANFSGHPSMPLSNPFIRGVELTD